VCTVDDAHATPRNAAKQHITPEPGWLRRAKERLLRPGPHVLHREPVVGRPDPAELASRRSGRGISSSGAHHRPGRFAILGLRVHRAVVLHGATVLVGGRRSTDFGRGARRIAQWAARIAEETGERKRAGRYQRAGPSATHEWQDADIESLVIAATRSA